MAEQKLSKNTVLQFIKFALFSVSAGAIQIISFTLLNEVVLKLGFMQELIAQNDMLNKILTNEYGLCYLIALILSVVWNFTFNRKFTFKSAANIPVAMLKVFGFYLVFTPVSTILGIYFSNKFETVPGIDYIVLAVTMMCNMITEYLFCKFVVYRNQENTAENGKKEEKTTNV